MSELCVKLHEIIHKGKLFDFCTGYESIPKNGIYIMFEKGETAHGGDRIVRIGSHTGNDQLRSRIFQHFENENKNRSIFRKNIGRCFLNKINRSYLPIWELDTTSKKNKEQYSQLIEKKFEIDLERQISEYIQMKISFCVLDIPSKQDRLCFEAKLIGTVSGCSECIPSENWLGRYSPKDKIKGSGLWQVIKLYSQTLNEEELSFISAALVRE